MSTSGKYKMTKDKYKTQTTVSRKIVENKLGRELSEELVVHHIDGNKSNNNEDNLEIMTRRKHSSLHAKKVESIKCICKNCMNVFYLKPSVYRTRIKTNSRGSLYCSRRCSGIGSHL